MANLIKKKLVQELARFTKNLQPDAIKISSLKGEGELASLELDEDFLSAVLQLPGWLKLSKVICRNIKIKIHWTKLKSEPVLITMSDVDVYVETCEQYQPRDTAPTKSKSPHEYGLVDKVIDGVSLTVSNVTVHFKSPGFNSDLTISEVNMRSVDKDFAAARLENTRYAKSDTTTTRKLISWNSLRVQAIAEMLTNEHQPDGAMTVAPILLITNQSSIRLTMTKRLADCVLTATRLEVHFDTFLWVLTSSQLFAAAMFARTLSLLIQRVTRQKREMASRSTVSYKYGAGAARGHDGTDAGAKELEHGIQASHHLRLSMLELQLCDDQRPSSGDDGSRGASMQLLLRGLALDFYPNRTAWSQGQERSMRNEYTAQCQTWITTLLQRYSWEGQAQLGFTPDSPLSRKAVGDSVVHPIYLRENWLITSLRDIQIGCVSTGKTEHLPEALFKSSKKELHIPDHQPAFQLELTSYFYEPAMPDYCVPWPHMYGWVNPVQIIFHEPTLLWMLNLSKTMATHVNGFIRTLPAELFEESTEEAEKDIRLEFVMPKVTLPLTASAPAAAASGTAPSSSVLFPHALQFQASRMTVTNCGHHGTTSTRTELQIKSQQFQAMDFFSPDSKFPYRPGDLSCLPSFTGDGGATPPQSVGETSADASQAAGTASARPSSTTADAYSSSPTNSDAATAVIWNLRADQCWLDFLYKGSGGEKEKERNIPFVGSLPLDLSVCALNATAEQPGRLHVLLQSADELNVLLERAELLWLLSLRDEIKTLHTTILAMFLDPLQQPASQSSGQSESDGTTESAAQNDDGTDEEAQRQHTFAAVSLQSGVRVSLLLPNPDSRHRLLQRHGSTSSLLGGNLSSLLPSAVFSIPTPSPPPPGAPGGIPLVQVPEYSNVDGDNVSLGAVSFDSNLGDASSLLGDATTTTSPMHTAAPAREPAAAAVMSLSPLPPSRPASSTASSSTASSATASSATASSATGSSANLASSAVGSQDSLLSNSATDSASGSSRHTTGDSAAPSKRPELDNVSSASSSSASQHQDELATLFQVSVAPALADIQVADDATTVIVAARKPRITTRPLTSAGQLRRFVVSGIGAKSAAPDAAGDDAASYEGRVLARISLGKSVTQEAAAVGIIDAAAASGSSSSSPDELLFGLVSAEAREVNLAVHERHVELLGAFFKLPPSDGTLPMHIKAVNCEARVDKYARPNGTQPEPNLVRVSDAIVSCLPDGRWVIGHLLPQDAEPDAVATAGQSPSGGDDGNAAVPGLVRENQRLAEGRKLVGDQLANCRLALEQAALDRDALLQTILRMQEEITKSNIAQDELHDALLHARRALKQLR